MRIVFMGTPDFAVPSLSAVAASHEVALVLTRPDAVRGRGRKLVPSPVKARAQGLGIPVLETTRVTDEVFEALRQAQPDLIVVVAYGCLLPDRVLDLAPLGCVNVHASLLPRWRGAAPIQRAVFAGDERAGVSVMRLVHEMDAGAYCRQASVEVGEKDCATVMSELAELGARELLAALPTMEDGTVQWTEQDPSLVTFAAKIEKAEMLLDPADAAELNVRRVRASLDAAPARLVVAGKGVRALAAHVSGESLGQGAVLARKGHVFLGCSDGSLELDRVKPDGKREMDAGAWAAGLRGEPTWERA